jgi:hypothetical protein
MTDKVPMPVSGNPESKGAPDGVSGSPGGDTDRTIDGRKGGGESEGGAYPNPHSGKKPEGGGFMGQAGDEGQSAPNAVAGSAGEGDVDGSSGVPTAEHTRHDVPAADGSVAVEETSGNAAAEATGKVGTDAAYDDAQKHPGSG